jgi:purine-cytosine permease-like protein
VAETDEAFANAYSGAVSLQNLVPAMPQAALVVLTTALGTLGALLLELSSFQSFLFLLGSCFVPLFAVLLADWLAAGRRYDADDVFSAVPLRGGPILAWIAGFAAYQWLSPTGPGWWVEQVNRLEPPSWQIGATLPSFAVSFLLGFAAAVATRRSRTRTVGA